MKRLKEFFDEYCFLLILNCVAIFLSGFSICCNIDSISLENYNIIIGFIGALATFVVISNYVQVVKIEEKFVSEVEKLKNENETNLEKINNSIEELKKYTFEASYIAAINNDYISQSEKDEEKESQESEISKDILKIIGNKTMTIESLANQVMTKNKDENYDTKVVSNRRVYIVVKKLINNNTLKIVGNFDATSFESYIVKLNNTIK